MNDLLQSDKKNIWHPFTPLIGSDPLLITQGKGVYLHTADGRKIIDAISSWWVNIHGHGNPYIAKAVAEQALELEHVIFAGFTHKPAIKLAENLISILPKNQSKIFFSDNGSTAVEVALKMATQYWRNQGITRKRIIALDGAYHGDTFGSMSVGERSLFTEPFIDYLFQVDFITFPTPENEQRVFDQFRKIIDTNEVSVFIVEPLVQAAAGMRMYSTSILNQLIKYAQENGVICIADEVFTGFGRTGKLFASDHLDVFPDIIALSKGLTGGTLPMGITSCSEKIAKAFLTDDFSKTFFHGHSFTANPLSCAAANASFDLLMETTCQENIRRIERKHKEFKNELKQHIKIKEARSLGTILALELNTGESGYTNEIRKKIYPFFLSKDLLIRPLGNVVYIVPPYIITDSELDRIYNAILEFLDTL